MDTNNKDEVIIQDEKSYNKEIKSVPKPEVGIGIDTKDVFFDNIIAQGIASAVDITKINAFSQTAQSREEVYQMLDTMCDDSLLSAVLETFAADATETNDYGQIIWCESADANVSAMVNFLLDTMRVDKHMYKWVYQLCKYGDLYLRLYRQSELKDHIFSSDEIDKLDLIEEKKSNVLNEEIKIKAYSKQDRYAHYMEAAQNPAEIFELTKFGKTYGYIKAEVKAQGNKTQNQAMNFYQYKFKEGDIEIHNATDFVHASLEDNSSRTVEEVDIFIDNGEEDSEVASMNYSVRRGQSLFYNLFKVWRQLSLLENSVLLNRLTKSSIVRAIAVEIGDMPKEQVGAHLSNIKSLIEQKSALDTGNSYSEYTNPGPIENNIYVPTREGKGAISVQQIGGDVDVKSLIDLDYFKNKMFGSLGIPKQYFGDTDDGAGFNGGQSLAIISSPYAKKIKRIQNTMIQAITDAINLMLLDKGLDNYINKFAIRMQAPTTQEELDRRDNLSNKIGVASDMMNMFADIEDPISKLKILKNLVSNIVTDDEIIQILQKEIEKLEKEVEEGGSADMTGDTDMGSDTDMGADMGGGISDSEPLGLDDSMDSGDTSGDEGTLSTEDAGSSEDLPSPEDLGIDMTDNDSGE